MTEERQASLVAAELQNTPTQSLPQSSSSTVWFPHGIQASASASIGSGGTNESTSCSQSGRKKICKSCIGQAQDWAPSLELPIL
eukprot:CAMPEP_0204156560 /NCGR_PEP_ID=MMETSP0361-20130328/30532_1 /ASSEMBLY_ACC=CAM_ASM_000343 /TAXON_ID=268821 /ORGANISM="Scrippsiella Hangoei, Strain SHTV-5" /LENGTH=83 /DNA_ID=CAMNT_0051112211 /DNA_START=248 /DNA_END=499 /DNA_ORIENTATION=+